MSGFSTEDTTVIRSTLAFIHIGKCGGGTIFHKMAKSPVLKMNFQGLQHIHIVEPQYDAHQNYMFVVRNPIRRALSAFNWRYHLVVETAAQADRFPPEFDILKKHGTFNSLCEGLYSDAGHLDEQTAWEWKKIHHLKEDIRFYLKPLLPSLRCDQVFGILAQENLDADIERVLGLEAGKGVHRHGHKVAQERLQLSTRALRNARRFLDEEYKCLKDLFAIARYPDHMLQSVLCDKV